ncbi:MAG TPA: hypothetical protein VGG16_02410, partial [Streptosporangiaceae bacterium]
MSHDDCTKVSQGLGRLRNGGIPSRAGQGVPAGSEIPVELSLDGVKEFGNMLVLINQHRLGRLNETAGIGTHRRPRRRVVAVDHRPAEAFGQLAEQGALAHGPRPVEDQHRLFGEARCHDIDKTTLRKPGQNL